MALKAHHLLPTTHRGTGNQHYFIIIMLLGSQISGPRIPPAFKYASTLRSSQISPQSS